jgi:RNA polymerase sigma-70 factor (ECF subfamily)
VRQSVKGPELTTPSDKALIRAVIGGEKDAYEKLYDRYAPLVRAVCYDTTGNIADAQDLAQDVFLRAYEKLERLRNSESFGKWIIGIARLRCKEWQRQKLRSQNRNVGLNNARAVVSDPPDDSRIELLREMIRTLPEKERLALHTFYLHGNSAEAGRRIMGLSRSGFYRVLDRARKHLEKLMSEEQEKVR